MEGIKNILAAILVNFPVAVVKMRYLMRFKRLPNLKNKEMIYRYVDMDSRVFIVKNLVSEAIYRYNVVESIGRQGIG